MTNALALICVVPFLVGAAGLTCRRGARLKALLAVGTGLDLLLAVAAELHSGGLPVGGLLRLDPLAAVLLAVVAGVGALATADSCLLWRAELDPARPTGLPVRMYFFWQQAFVGSLLLAALSANLGVSWLAIELTTVTSAVLVGFDGRARAVEAAWKYVILCSVGLALALLTVVVLYALSGGGGLHALGWTALTRAAAGFPAGPAKLAFLFALVGFGTKAGLAPLHPWLPDAHSEAPAPVSALLSGVLLAVVLCTLVRIANVTALATGSAFPDRLLLGAGLLSVAVATPFMVVQEDLKRLLAYSSIEQVGLMAVGFGLHVPLAVDAAILQVVVHALTKSGLFFAAGHMIHEVGSQRLARLKGLGRRAPLLGAALFAGVLTLGGLPPFGMFFTELAIVQGTLAANIALGLVLLALLVGIFGGLAYYAGNAVFGRSSGGVAARPGATVAAVLGVPAVLSVVVGFWTPGALARGISAAAALLLGGHAL